MTEFALAKRAHKEFICQRKPISSNIEVMFS